MRARQLFVLAILAALLTSSVPLASSKMTGITDVENGCICHSAVSSPDVVIVLDGLPDQYEANVTYELTISVEGGAVPVVNATNTAGFNLWFHSGALANTSDDAWMTDDEPMINEYTHTLAGNDQRSWTLLWTAPLDDSLSVDWRLTVNTVIGDEIPSDSDKWNQMKGAVVGVNGTAEEPINDLYLYGIPVGLVLLSIGVYVAVTRESRMAAREEE